MFIERAITQKLLEAVQSATVVILLGPRQAGKTALAQHALEHWRYVSFEDEEMRTFARDDPKGFLAAFPHQIILDEIHRAPSLLPRLKKHIESSETPARFLIINSHQFASLADFVALLGQKARTLNLLPLSIEELHRSGSAFHDFETLLFQGFYPELYAYNLPPAEFFPEHVNAYVERRVRFIRNIADIDLFLTFMKMCAARIGRVLNLTRLAEDCGVTFKTAKSWLQVLENSFIVFQLPMFRRPARAQSAMTTKIYFYDAGLASSLLGVKQKSDLIIHSLKGEFFESFIIADLMKTALSGGRRFRFSFWRDRAGHEVDLILETGDEFLAIDFKAGQTFNRDYFAGLNAWSVSHDSLQSKNFVVYGGQDKQKHVQATVLGWNRAAEILEDLEKAF